MKNYSVKPSMHNTKDETNRKTESYIIIDGAKWRIRTLSELNQVTEQRIRVAVSVKLPAAAASEESSAPRVKKDEVPAEAFREGSLLRGILEKKIFVIENGFRKYIYPAALNRYCGRRVWTVADEELSRIPAKADDRSFGVNYLESLENMI